MIETIQENNKVLDAQNQLLTNKLNTYEGTLSKFLTTDQIKSLSKEKQKKWDDETIIKGLKFRFSLGENHFQLEICLFTCSLHLNT